MPHPQSAVEYANYSFREFLGQDLFKDKQILQPSDLLTSLAVISEQLIDMEIYHKAIPLCALQEYLAREVCESKILVIKARIMKANALLEVGMINEAYQIYRRVLEQQDLPQPGARVSEYSIKQSGQNFQFPSKECYYNNLSPEHENNAEALEMIKKPIEPTVIAKLKEYCSPYIVETLQVLRALFLVRLGETENTENLEKAELRNGLLRNAEESLRTSLKQVQVAEEIAHYQHELDNLTIREINKPEEEIEKLNASLTQCFNDNQIPENEQESFYKNSEEEMCHADQRCQRLSLILRCRLYIGRLYQKQG